MKYTFFLKEPKSEKETLILFSSYFKNEGKKFVYSTGENINPANWDKANKFPQQKTRVNKSIINQLNRYSGLFEEIVGRYKNINEDLTSKELKKAFDEEFKKSKNGKNIFFDAYDIFMCEKQNDKVWGSSTVKRYKNIRNLLKSFESDKNYPLNFNSINKVFYTEFVKYCFEDKNHINNTFLRNLGLFKTFMYWAIDEKYTYNTAFKEFNFDKNKNKKLRKVITQQVALTIEDLKKLMDYDCPSERMERIRDVFVFQCVTGMRFGELATIRKSNVTNTHIILKEEKESMKEARQIPLSEISRYILKKYDYSLPLITNQKQNEYIKEMFKNLGYTHTVEKVTTKGKENIKIEVPFWERISTHTARRTCITLLKKNKYSDKLISKITGHTDLKTLNQYYQVDDEQTSAAMNDTFDIKAPLKVVSNS